MKKMITLFALSISLSSGAAFADDSNSCTAELVNINGEKTAVYTGNCAENNVVGGGCKAELVNIGGEQTVVYTGTCYAKPVCGRTYVVSDYGTVFPTLEAATEHCNIRDSVVASYGWNFQIRGYVCQELSGDMGGHGSSN